MRLGALLRWHDWPWSAKLALLLGVLAVLPLSVVTLIHGFAARDDLLAATRAQSLQQARNTAQAIDRYLEGIRADVRVVASAPWTVRVLAPGSGAELRSQVGMALREMRDTHGFEALYLTDRSGVVRLATEERLVGRSYFSSRPFLEAKAGNNTVSEPRYDPQEDKVFLHASAPVRLPDGPIVGAAIGRVELSRLDEIVNADTNFAGRREIGILWNADGIRLSHPTQPHLRFKPFEPLPRETERRLVAESRFGRDTRERLRVSSAFPGIVERSRWISYDPASDPHLVIRLGDEDMHATLVPLRTSGWTYGIFTPEHAILAALREQIRRDLAIASLTGLLAVAFGLAAARWATRPLRLVWQTADAIAAGDMSRRVGLRQRDEIGRLAVAFDSMTEAVAQKEAELRSYADRLEQRVDEQTAALRASEAELRALFAAMRDAIFVFDETGRCLKVAPTRAESSSPVIAELREKSLHEVFPRERADYFLSQIRQALETRQTVHAEYDLMVNGAWIWLEAAITPLLERSVVWVARDVTSRKRAEEERRELLLREQEARHRAEEANRIKDEFLSTLSHELRTPLNAILGWTWLLQSGSLDAEGMQRAVATIERNAKSQSQIIDDLLDVSRIITGKLRLKVRRVALEQILEVAIDAARPAADAKEIRIESVFEPEVPPVSGDPNRLQQIVWNLLSNAVKFTPTGGRIEVRLETAGGQARVQVRDTGIGIREDFLAHVFERFRQADSSTTRTHGGLGLGLAIVRHLVELHGGTVQAESPGEGCGSTFTVLLPITPLRTLRETEPPAGHPQAAKGPREIQEIRGIRVLLVDDEADAREMLPPVLERFGAAVTVTASAEEALAALRGQGADVLVADIGMPGTDGYELIRQIRALEGPARDVPAIALTAYAGDGDRRRALEAGYQLHLAKPVEPLQLAAALVTVAGGSVRP